MFATKKKSWTPSFTLWRTQSSWAVFRLFFSILQTEIRPFSPPDLLYSGPSYGVVTGGLLCATPYAVERVPATPLVTKVPDHGVSLRNPPWCRKMSEDGGLPSTSRNALRRMVSVGINKVPRTWSVHGLHMGDRQPTKSLQV